MNHQIKTLLQNAEGRYFTEVEGELLIAYGETILARLDTMQAVERAEKAIVDDVVPAVFERFPAFKQEYGPSAEPLIRRDQTLSLRYATFAMILQDEGFIYDKLAVWFRTIIFSFVKPDLILAGYAALHAGCRTHLTAEDAEMVIKFTKVIVRELEANIPQLAKAS